MTMHENTKGAAFNVWQHVGLVHSYKFVCGETLLNQRCRFDLHSDSLANANTIKVVREDCVCAELANRNTPHTHTHTHTNTQGRLRHLQRSSHSACKIPEFKIQNDFKELFQYVQQNKDARSAREANLKLERGDQLSGCHFELRHSVSTKTMQRCR